MNNFVCDTIPLDPSFESIESTVFPVLLLGIILLIFIAVIVFIFLKWIKKHVNEDGN